MTTTTDQPRVIGRRRSKAKRETFSLAVYRGEVEELWPLTVRAQMDTSSVFALSADDTTPGKRLTGLRNFLMRAFVDDDGVPLTEQPVQVVPAEKAGEESTDDVVVASGELVVLGDDDADGRPVQWRVGGLTFPSESLARSHADENGSSLRRFIYVMDSMFLAVEQSALEELVDIVVSSAADRPTEPSGASSRSRAQRRR